MYQASDAVIAVGTETWATSATYHDGPFTEAEMVDTCDQFPWLLVYVDIPQPGPLGMIR